MDSLGTAARKTIWRDARAIALLMAAMLTTMANATISPALPGLQRLFAEDPYAEILTRLLVPAPSLSVALSAPIAGLAADRFGRRRLLLLGVILFVVAGSAGLFLPDLPTIFTSRLVLGLAVGLIMTAQTALIGDYFSGAERSALTGLQISARNFGGLVFIALAGCAALISPRMPFAIYALATILLPLMWRVIVDVSPLSPGQCVGAAAGTEGTSWRLFFSGLVLLQALTNLLFFIVPTQLPFFFDAHGHGGGFTGAALGTLMLSGGVFALLYPRFYRTASYAGVFVLGYAAMALGFALLSAGADALAFAGGASIGAGYALVSPTFVALVLNLAPARRRGLAGGILTSSVFIGQFCSPLLSTPAISAFHYEGLFGGTALLLATMALAAAVCAAVARLRSRLSPTASS
ncbi:MFS transporter [Ensifer sp. LCM 4579]|uniref:MFS transporter n=1 Tax=Ensifer sp. LCM 4579 TaxID=1848292 RepID=UPI0008DA61F9|nr:MFS transporter [Ensifer sp. LCM 4579]OHV75488.1 MFS transporter [Ensifer sp. LCM 4579]